jgi:hypothetical protein
MMAAKRSVFQPTLPIMARNYKCSRFKLTGACKTSCGRQQIGCSGNTGYIGLLKRRKIGLASCH